MENAIALLCCLSIVIKRGINLKINPAFYIMCVHTMDANIDVQF